MFEIEAHEYFQEDDLYIWNRLDPESFSLCYKDLIEEDEKYED